MLQSRVSIRDYNQRIISFSEFKSLTDLSIKAINYTAGKGSKWIKIIVTDTGIGIPENEYENIFTPFYSTKAVGRGYGLWRAKTVIESFGGRVNVDSKVNVGTSFTVLLPKSKGDGVNEN